MEFTSSVGMFYSSCNQNVMIIMDPCMHRSHYHGANNNHLQKNKFLNLCNLITKYNLSKQKQKTEPGHPENACAGDPKNRHNARPTSQLHIPRGRGRANLSTITVPSSSHQSFRGPVTHIYIVLYLFSNYVHSFIYNTKFMSHLVYIIWGCLRRQRVCNPEG